MLDDTWISNKLCKEHGCENTCHAGLPVSTQLPLYKT